MRRPSLTAEKLYNVKILRNYVGYLRDQLHWEQRKLEDLFRECGTDISFLDSDDNWFSQDLANAFQSAIVRHSGDADIAFKVGRFMTTESAKGIAGRMIRGLLKVETAFSRIQNLAGNYTRGSRYDLVSLSHGHAVLRSTPINDCREAPHQCRNRFGMLTSVPAMFGCVVKKAEHPKCYHRGDDCCEYVLQWSDVRARGILLASFVATIGSAALLLAMAERGDAAVFGGLVGGLLTFLSLYSQAQNRYKDILREQYDALSESVTVMDRRSKEAWLIRDIMRLTTRIMPVDELCRLAVEQIQAKMQYDRVALLLVDDAKKLLKIQASAGFSREAMAIMQRTEFRIRPDNTSGFLVRAVNTKNPILIRDVVSQLDQLSERSRELVGALGIRAFLAMPVIFEERVLGVLTVDYDRSERQLSSNDLELCQGLADHLAVSINNAITYAAKEESLRLVRAMEAAERRRKEAFQMYVPTEIVDEQQLSDARRRGMRKELLSVLAVDIAGFTTLSERRSPEAVASILTIYIDVINDVVCRWGGKINKVIGDGMLIYFDTQNPNAIRAGLNILHSRHAINRRLSEKGYSPIAMRLGAHRGECIIGSIGSKRRRDYTLIGDVVNTAFRIESFGKKIGQNIFCFSSELLPQAEGQKYIDRGTVPLQGRRSLTRLYQLVRTETGAEDDESDDTDGRQAA